MVWKSHLEQENVTHYWFISTRTEERNLESKKFSQNKLWGKFKKNWEAKDQKRIEKSRYNFI